MFCSVNDSAAWKSPFRGSEPMPSTCLQHRKTSRTPFAPDRWVFRPSRAIRLWTSSFGSISAVILRFRRSVITFFGTASVVCLDRFVGIIGVLGGFSATSSGINPKARSRASFAGPRNLPRNCGPGRPGDAAEPPRSQIPTQIKAR